MIVCVMNIELMTVKKYTRTVYIIKIELVTRIDIIVNIRLSFKIRYYRA